MNYLPRSAHQAARVVTGRIIAFMILLMVLLAAAPLPALEVTVCRDAAVPQSVFAAGEIRSAVEAMGGTITEVPLTVMMKSTLRSPARKP